MLLHIQQEWYTTALNKTGNFLQFSINGGLLIPHI